jgi:translation initiation factor 3 subunit M
MTSSLILNNEAINEIALLAADTTGKRDLVETCVSLYDQGHYDQVCDALFSVLDNVIENAPENDAESFALVLVNILLKSEKKDDKIQQLIQLITKTSDTCKHRLRLRLAAHVLNALSHTEKQHFKVFLSVLQYAKSIKQAERVSKYADLINNMLDEWNTSIEDRRTVYLIFYDILTEAGEAERASSIIFKYLSTFTKKEDVTDSVANYAVKAVVEAIKLNYRFDGLMQLVLIQQLQYRESKLYELLKIFLSGSVSDFEAFAAQNRDLITKYGFSQDELTKKMRLLTLTSLFSRKSVQSIPYATLAKELGIDESEVESYVIHAIGQGVIDARLNQLSRTVTILKTIHREFSIQEWKNLGNKISKWQGNVGSMLQTIRSKKEEALKGPGRK